MGASDVNLGNSTGPAHYLRKLASIHTVGIIGKVSLGLCPVFVQRPRIPPHRGVASRRQPEQSRPRAARTGRVHSQPNDVISTVDVDRFAGYAARQIAQQVEARSAHLMGVDVALKGGFLRGVFSEFVEAGNTGRA
jgi:hypothetical protein